MYLKRHLQYFILLLLFLGFLFSFIETNGEVRWVHGGRKGWQKVGISFSNSIFFSLKPIHLQFLL